MKLRSFFTRERIPSIYHIDKKIYIYHPTDWEIFKNPVSDRGVIFKISKELKKVGNNKPNNPIKSRV